MFPWLFMFVYITIGTGWVALDGPDPDDKLIHVAVGEMTVWVTSVSGNVMEYICIIHTDNGELIHI